MLVLGIETSCDETAAALVEADGDRPRVRTSVVWSQIAVHRPYGGVVPELAARCHLTAIVPVIERALGGLALDAVDGVAVTRGPGLIGALLVGLQAAKAIAFARGLPLAGVHHLDGHLAAVDLGEEPARYPHVALLVSGGHTGLFEVRAPGRYRLLGETRDDAAGEAFDKVAKMLGLGYPGGPAIEERAAAGDPEAVRLPRALPRRDDLSFSFSGLKTAAAQHLRARAWRGEADVLARPRECDDMCASFQQAVVDVLARKARRAVERARADLLVAAGGVLANRAVREALGAAGEKDGFQVRYPPVALCTDNAAMIAAAGWRRLSRGERDDPMALPAIASWPLAEAPA